MAKQPQQSPADVAKQAGKLGELRPISERWLREMGVGAGMLPDVMERIESVLPPELGRPACR